MTITINNEARNLMFRFRRMKRLGIEGHGDTANIGRVLGEALNNFDSLANLLSVGIGEQPNGEIVPSEHVYDFIDTLDTDGVANLLRDIGPLMGVTIQAAPAQEGEKRDPPENSSAGTNAGPPEESTSA